MGTSNAMDYPLRRPDDRSLHEIGSPRSRGYPNSMAARPNRASAGASWYEPLDGLRSLNEMDQDWPQLARKKSIFPWKRKQQEMQSRVDRERRLRREETERRQAEAEQHRLQLEQEALQRQVEAEQHRRQLEQERQALEQERAMRAAMEQEKRQREEAARQRAQAEQARKAKAQADRRRREELQAQRRREIEAKRNATSPEALQHLRELVRQRYELDNEIWKHRKVRRADQPVLKAKMDQADALLQEIQGIVRGWRIDGDAFDDAEARVAIEIRDRLLEDGKRNWAKQPPWAS